ncbi:phospholipase D family protein [Candidatus Woesearchaeota archaeon]|nr:phospholipase D family protein [Candidatus Woesearchaeota archaeon]
MFINKANCSIFLGRDAGSHCLNVIQRAKKEVKIVSPYLSTNYIRELIKLHKKGVKITLITSDNLANNRDNSFDPTEIIEQEQIIHDQKVQTRKNGFWISSGIGMFMLFLSFAAPALLILVLGAIISAIIFFTMRTNEYKYKPIFKLKIFSSREDENGGRGYLIHSKVYVIDNEHAFLGSINFTNNGFSNSYESAIKTDDKQAVKKISEEIDWVYKNAGLAFTDIQEWGQELYAELEPKNSGWRFMSDE